MSKELTVEHFEKVLREIVQDWGKAPCDINNGDCESLAQAVIESCGESTEELYIEVTPDDWFGYYPGHIWIAFKNRHYDAECLKGADDWHQLPIFDRVNKL